MRRYALPALLALTGTTTTTIAVTLWWRWEPVAATLGLLLTAMAVTIDFNPDNNDG